VSRSYVRRFNSPLINAETTTRTSTNARSQARDRDSHGFGASPLDSMPCDSGAAHPVFQALANARTQLDAIDTQVPRRQRAPVRTSLAF
jgi:hypothetical protein